GCPRNPVLSARHLGRKVDVVGPGHADLVQTQDGDWWAVLLAARPSDGDWWGTSRETFLVPVGWEDGWPVFAPGVGRVPLTLESPSLRAHPWPVTAARDDFDDAELSPEWSMLRTPHSRWWSLSERPGQLRLRLRPEAPDSFGNPSMVLRRVEHAHWRASMSLDFAPAGPGCVAGLAVWVNDTDQLRVEADGLAVRVIRREHSTDATIAELVVEGGPVVLGVEAQGRQLTVRAGQVAAATLDIGFLGQRVNGYFFGMLVGPYATGSTGFADVDWFDYAGLSPPG
ncbi:MAG: family 43 glycosylhydrolase, partial [Actinomycetota bacterium]